MKIDRRPRRRCSCCGVTYIVPPYEPNPEDHNVCAECCDVPRSELADWAREHRKPGSPQLPATLAGQR